MFYVAGISHFPSFVVLLQETVSSDFDDLGQMLLAGFALAVVVAVGIVVIKRRAADKNPPPQFMSITATRGDDE